MSEQIAIMLYIKNMLADLIYINGIIATQLIKVVENIVTDHQGEDLQNKKTNLVEHNQLKTKIIEILKKYQKSPEDLAALNSQGLKNNKE